MSSRLADPPTGKKRRKREKSEGKRPKRKKPNSSKKKREAKDCFGRSHETQNLSRKRNASFPSGKGDMKPLPSGSASPFPRSARASATPDRKGSRQLTQLQQKLEKRLQGGRFRMINERLYTTSGPEAAKLFKEQPEMFDQYHTGFRKQVSQWPQNPLDVFIGQIKVLPKNSVVIADMGCGEARLAQSVRQKVHSFDLHAGNKYITACDISNVPLSSESVDIVVFCLALMGTNFMEFLREAHRILKLGGALKIAEVQSRFEGNTKGFIDAVVTTGFTSVHTDERNKMFSLFEFTKSTAECGHSTFTLKACVYKKR